MGTGASQGCEGMGLERRGCMMRFGPSQECVVAFCKWAGTAQKASLCEMQREAFWFLVLAGKTDESAVKIFVRSGGGWVHHVCGLAFFLERLSNTRITSCSI